MPVPRAAGGGRVEWTVWISSQRSLLLPTFNELKIMEGFSQLLICS
jgi:hypothetical protein